MLEELEAADARRKQREANGTMPPKPAYIAPVEKKCKTCGTKRGAMARVKALASLACSAARSILFGPAIDPDIAQARHGKCKTCPLYQVHQGKPWCGVPAGIKSVRVEEEEGCGCRVDLLVEDPTKACPLKNPNWPAVMVLDPRKAA